MEAISPLRARPSRDVARLLPIILALAAPVASAASYDEPFRPQYHFTPAQNWMNDPNGMVFFEGEYHLFYQYNPFGDRWGHMSWGHAVSRDLVHWEHLPLALAEENGVMIFSGSAVVDWNNTSGFGQDGKPPLVAIYTGHSTEKPLQNQHIAFSNDRGRTWTKFAGNPVLDIGEKDFRDPKVMWHEPTKRWIMTVSMPADRKVRFYDSSDLKSWTRLGGFGPAGAIKGIWECPDLFPLPVEGTSHTKWVLIVNLGDQTMVGGSGVQYFVGEFDGSTFVAEKPAKAWPAGEDANWVDYAKDFYAAVSWSDVPEADGRRLWIGWMSNWQYAQDVPTAPWRSAMSIPRALSLRRVGGDWRLLQAPVKELESLRRDHRQHRLEKLSGRTAISGPDGLLGDRYEVQAVLTPSSDAVLHFSFRQGATESTIVRIDVAKGELTLDRTKSGLVNFHRDFPAEFRAPIRLIDGKLNLRVFVDRSSIELFVNGGETVMTSLILPDPASRGVELEVDQGELRSVAIETWVLESIWPQPTAGQVRRSR